MRTLAVVPVILFHAGFSAFSGGYVGVDVFFVISGYLITSIILGQLREGKFSLANFYERRARRILPALFLVMLVSLPFAWFCLLPHQLRYYAQSLTATTLFLSNVFFYLKSNYFGEAGDVTPLLHTWSLAVEEQFYLFFPLFLIFMARFGERWLARSLWALAIASFALAQAGVLVDQPAAFFLLPTRGWELLAGALACLYAMRVGAGDARPVTLSPALTQVLAMGGLVLIAIAVFGFNELTPFPAAPALVPTVGAALVLLFAGQDTWAGRLLGLRPLVVMGLISYSAYLWHQPLFAFARAASEQGLTGWQSAALCLLVLPLSVASWYYVERPVREGKSNGRKLLAGAVTLGAAFAALGFAGHRTDGFMDYQVSRIAPEYRRFVIDRLALGRERVEVWERLQQGSDRPFEMQPGKKRLLILGDSKAEDLFVSMDMNRALFTGLQIRLLTLDDECMGTMTAILQGRAPSMTERLHAMNAPRGRECPTYIARLQANHLVEDSDEIVLTTTWQDHTWKEGALYAIELARRTGHRVSVMGVANFNDMVSLSMRAATRQMTPQQAGRYFYDNIRADWNRPGDLMAQLMRGVPNTRYLEKLELFCDLPAKSCPMFNAAGDALVFDGGHVSARGAEAMGRRVSELGWFTP